MKSTTNGRELLDAAYVYMILHNKRFPRSPVFVLENGKLSSKSPCIHQDGFIIHKGHGPKTNCEKFV